MIKVVKMTFRQSRRDIASFKFAHFLIFTSFCFSSTIANYEWTFDRVFAMTCNHLHQMRICRKNRACRHSFHEFFEAQSVSKSNSIDSETTRSHECNSKHWNFRVYSWLERIHSWIENTWSNLFMCSRFCLLLHNINSDHYESALFQISQKSSKTRHDKTKFIVVSFDVTMSTNV